MERYEKKLVENPQDQSALDMIDFYKSYKQQRLELEETTEWRTDNLEYDLRTNELIIEKCADDVYAQNLYAALCNNEFTRNDVWPILTDKRWSCSWRSAGGIIADIQQEGDYIDWYCSGIRNETDLDDESFRELSNEEQESYLKQKAFVGEGVITAEIKSDLNSLGWIIVDSQDDY